MLDNITLSINSKNTSGFYATATISFELVGDQYKCIVNITRSSHPLTPTRPEDIGALDFILGNMCALECINLENFDTRMLYHSELTRDNTWDKDDTQEVVFYIPAKVAVFQFRLWADIYGENRLSDYKEVTIEEPNSVKFMAYIKDNNEWKKGYVSIKSSDGWKEIIDIKKF